MILLYTHEILDWPFTETMIYLRKKDITGLAIYRNYDLQNVLTTKSMLDINSNYFILYFYMSIDSHLFFQFKQLYLILLCLVVTY
jgi:hypothetical protein